MPARIAL